MRHRNMLRLGAVLLALASFAAPALAQSVDNIPPPVRQRLDENGVDLTRASHNITYPVLTIGPDGPGGLALVNRIGRFEAGNSYDIGLFDMGIQGWRASVGLRSYAFTESGTGYVSADGSGATLVKSGSAWTLTASDGSRVVYDFLVKDTDDFQQVARGTSITYPTGEKVALAWASATWCTHYLDYCAPEDHRTAVRLQSVSSSLGYQLHYFYAGETAQYAIQADEWQDLIDIKAINTTVDDCDPTAHSCTLTESWPTNLQARRPRVWIDPDNGLLFHIQRPGSDAADITIEYDANARVTKLTRDGMVWDYAYSVSGNTATMVVTDPDGDKRTVVSDLAVGLPTSVKDELNRTTSYDYDGYGRLDLVTAPDGSSIDMSMIRGAT